MADTSKRLLHTMQRDGTYVLRVQVPLDFSAIAIISLHPAGKDSQGHTSPQQQLWATSVTSLLKEQASLRPLLAYTGQ